MSILDAPLRNVASKLIGQFGKSVTVTYVTSGTYDPYTGKSTPSTSDVSVTGVLTEYDVREVGDLIQAGDVKITIPALGVTAPEEDDKITVGSDVYQVVRVTSVYSGAQPAIHEIQARL